MRKIGRVRRGKSESQRSTCPRHLSSDRSRQVSPTLSADHPGTFARILPESGDDQTTMKTGKRIAMNPEGEKPTNPKKGCGPADPAQSISRHDHRKRRPGTHAESERQSTKKSSAQRPGRSNRRGRLPGTDAESERQGPAEFPDRRTGRQIRASQGKAHQTAR